MASYRLAKSLEVLRAQVNERWPTRSKNSDGWIGDTSHAARPSDHNPVNGIVHAIDITHDPAHGFDSYKFADALLKNQDPRMTYIISNGRIGSGPRGPQPGVWRRYTGKNPHDHHCHISVSAAGADDASAWNLSGYATAGKPAPYSAPPPSIAAGSSGPDVERLQRALGCKITGKFDPRSETDFALRLFQERRGLDPDGQCGPMTWAALALMTST